MQSPLSTTNGSTMEHANAASLKETESTSSTPSLSNENNAEIESFKCNSSSIDLSSTDQEVVRLIGLHLRDLGLQKSCEKLMLESGCNLEHVTVSKFCEHIMQGRWSKVEATLSEIKPLLKHQRHVQKIRFYVMEQKFLELLEDGKVVEALKCLRNQLTPIRIFVNRIHQLSSFLMISSPEELHKAANWDGKGSKSRTKLVGKLQEYFPMSVMMQPRRLKSLLEQAMLFQQKKCFFHNSSAPPEITSFSLLADHVCSRRIFPSANRKIILQHDKEVLCCQFSHNGRMLATGAKNCGTIWNVDPVTHDVTYWKLLTDHPFDVSLLSWSPDDAHILACGTEEACELWLWNVETGLVHSKFRNSSEDSLSCCCWMADGKRFVTGGNKGQFYKCDLDGNMIDSWDGVRLQSVGPLPDNKTVLVADTQQRVRAYNFDDLSDYLILKEDHPILCMSISSDGRLILLNVATQGIHLWDIESRMLTQKYHGVSHGYYLIFSCFGGDSDQYIASGSDDNKIYIWHQSQETPIETLTGHTRNVNCVSWNKAIPSMLASASNDGTIRIWGPQDTSGSDDVQVQSDH